MKFTENMKFTKKVQVFFMVKFNIGSTADKLSICKNCSDIDLASQWMIPRKWLQAAAFLLVVGLSLLVLQRLGLPVIVWTSRDLEFILITAALSGTFHWTTLSPWFSNDSFIGSTDVC